MNGSIDGYKSRTPWLTIKPFQEETISVGKWENCLSFDK